MYGLPLSQSDQIIRSVFQSVYNKSLYFYIVSAKNVKVPIELSEDCYCNLSVPIPNEQTLDHDMKNSHFGLLSIDVSRIPF